MEADFLPASFLPHEAIRDSRTILRQTTIQPKESEILHGAQQRHQLDHHQDASEEEDQPEIVPVRTRRAQAARSRERREEVG